MSALIRALDFTKSVGHRRDDKDTTFTDVMDYGGFPYDVDEDTAVIVGLKVTYMIRQSDGTNKAETVSHGLVNETLLHSVIIAKNEMIVGAHGQLKDLSSDTDRDKRIATIGFVVFNKDTAEVTLKGPYPNKPKKTGDAWAAFGPIIAFQGTRTDDLGLTSLGITKAVQGVPDFGIMGN